MYHPSRTTLPSDVSRNPIRTSAAFSPQYFFRLTARCFHTVESVPEYGATSVSHVVHPFVVASGVQ